MDTRNTIHSRILDVLQHDDEARQDLKPFRRRIREICTSGRATILERIDTPIIEWPAVAAYNTFISYKDISKESELPLHPTPIDFVELKTKNRAVLEMYTNAMDRMFKAYERIETKIQSLEELEDEFVHLSCIDEEESPALKALQERIEAYLVYKYEVSGVSNDYKEFYASYKEWRMYRDVVLQAHAVTDISGSGSICSICTSERLSVALVPCGHTFCTTCAGRQKKHCFICRGDVKDRMRIFFT